MDQCIKIGSKRKAFILDKVESKDKTSKPIIIGDVKLSEFKKVLGVNGYSPEFVHGNLMFAQLGIIIRKDQSGKLILEGKVSDDYFTIRNLIYAQHVLLN